MYDTTSGEILIDKNNIRDIKLQDLRTLMGTVTQESILFSDTISNNIGYGALTKITQKEITKASKIAGDKPKDENDIESFVYCFVLQR